MPTSLGPAEILVILIVALIVLGPKRLPEAARQVGKTLAEVRKWSQGLQEEVRNVMDPDSSSPPSYSYPPLPTLPAETPTLPPETAGPPPETAGPPPETVATNGHTPVEPMAPSEDRAPEDEADPPAADSPRS